MEEAVAMDPSLKWLYVRCGYFWIAQRCAARAEKLQASDPDNAVSILGGSRKPR